MAGAVACELAAAGLGFLIGVWIAALLIVGTHEAGHAYAARRLRVPTSAMVIGVGPMIARFVWLGLRIEVRALPVIGWVEMDRSQVPGGSLRIASVYVAGPVASLLLSVVVLLGAFAWFQGPTEVGLTDARFAVRTTVEGARSMWAAPFAPVPDAVERLLTDPSEGDTGSGTSDPSTVVERDDHNEQVVSVVGLTAATPSHVAEYGLGWVFTIVAGISASVAGLNLLPAWGLDGHGILEEAAWAVDRRSKTWGRRARLCVSLAGAVTSGLGLWLILGALLRDTVGLF